MIGTGIGPFAKRGLDEALGFAVGLWRIGLGANVLEAETLAGLLEGEGFVARASRKATAQPFFSLFMTWLKGAGRCRRDPDFGGDLLACVALPGSTPRQRRTWRVEFGLAVNGAVRNDPASPPRPLRGSA